MINEDIYELIVTGNLSQPDRLVLIMYSDSSSEEYSVSQIVSLGTQYGIVDIQNWNLSRALRSNPAHIRKNEKGYSLTRLGKAHAEKLCGHKREQYQTEQVLRSHLERISNTQVKQYAEEAIQCLETGCFRAAVIMAWEGALALLYHHILEYKLEEFNAEACRRKSRWRDASTIDEISNMREREFLDVAYTISVIGKNVKQQLVTTLELRNGCGHPNSLQVGEAKVRAHIETLIDNVYAPFS